MDKNFDKALKLVLKHEGGWSDNPKDPGGATMKGVTLATYRAYVKPKATKEELRKISDAEIATVYRRHYWDVVQGGQLPSGVDYATFDFAVNSGPTRAAKYLQDVVGVAQDGKIGPATLAAVKAKAPGVVIDQLCDDRLEFMKRIKDKKTGEPLWKTFGKGWSARVAGVRKEALLMTAPDVIEAPIVVPAQTTGGDTAVVVLPENPATVPPPAAPIPSVPVTRSGWASLIAVLGALIVGAVKYFGG